MRTTIAVAAITAVASAQQLVTDSIYTGAFGAITEETMRGEEIHRNVTFPTLPFAMDYEA